MDNKKLLKLILLVPGSVLLYIPLLLVLWENRGWPYTASGPVLLLSILLFWGGLALLVWAARLLIVEGQGTPLPMDPPANLVTDGPYRFVRNPMMLGAFAILLGEALYFESYFILIYFAVFFIAGLIMVLSLTLMYLIHRLQPRDGKELRPKITEFGKYKPTKSTRIQYLGIHN